MSKFYYTVEIAGLYTGTTTSTVEIEAESLDAGKPLALAQGKKEFHEANPGARGTILHAVVLFGFLSSEDLLKNLKPMNRS